MASISVQVREAGDQYIADVTVDEDGSSTNHTVEISKSYYQKLTSGIHPPELLVERSFEFLLQREPKESIMGSFNLTVINRYFGDYESTISDML